MLVRCLIVACALTAALAGFGCAQELHDGATLKSEPSRGSLPAGMMIYVDDGTCSIGEIKQLIGGNDSQGVRRQRRCVKRP